MVKTPAHISVLFLLIITFLAIPQSAISEGIPPSHIEFHSKIGSTPYMAVKADNKIETYGIIADPGPLLSFGFSDVKKGQKIRLIETGEHQWRVTNITTHQEKVIETPDDPVESFFKQVQKKGSSPN